MCRGEVKGPDDLENALRLLKRKLKREGFFLELTKIESIIKNLPKLKNLRKEEEKQ
jgi:ribosomal protein S21